MSDAKVADSSTCQRVGFEPAKWRIGRAALVFTDTFLSGIGVAEYHSVQKFRMQLRRRW